MVRMFVRHDVSDLTTWKKAYDDFDAERRGMGVLGDAVFQTHGAPNTVTAWHDFESIEAAQSFAGFSPAARGHGERRCRQSAGDLVRDAGLRPGPPERGAGQGIDSRPPEGVT